MVAAAGIAVAPRISIPSGARTTLTQQHPGYGIGYPRQGGLAGPSRPTAEHPGYGVGYPLHGGLAGPSRVFYTPNAED
jgi:hypothetical protein